MLQDVLNLWKIKKDIKLKFLMITKDVNVSVKEVAEICKKYNPKFNYKTKR